jgi:putative SOS response-associated peptidase YedK
MRRGWSCTTPLAGRCDDACMCGRFTQQLSTSEFARIFGAENLADDPGGHYNLAPMRKASVVVERGDRRAIVPYKWGFVPSWAKDPRIGSRMINARAETIATSPAFRSAFTRRRCIIPADAFYEWHRVGKGPSQPYVIRHEDGSTLALAGIWSAWREPDAPEGAEPLRTFSIVTTAANETLVPIHDRMPVILPADAWELWLGAEEVDPSELQGLLVPAPADGLIRFPVARYVSDVRNDGPILVEPVELAAEEAPPPA